MADNSIPHFDDTVPVASQASNDIPHFDDTLPVESQPQDQWSMTESVGQGTLQGITAGLSDEIGGAMGAGMETLLGKTNPDQSLFDLYNEYRTFQRGRNDTAYKQNSKAYIGGNILGGVASVPLLAGTAGVAGIAAPSAVLKALNSTKGLAGMGALTGLGASQAELASANPELGQAALDTGLGVVLGYGGAKLGGMFGKSAAQREAQASIQAAKAAGVPMAKELGKGIGIRPDLNKAQRGIGKTALEEGTLPLTGGPRKMYEETLDAIGRNEDELNKFYPEVAKELKGKSEDEILKGLNEVYQQKLMSQGATPEQVKMASGELGQKIHNKIIDISRQLQDRPDGQQLINKISNSLLKAEEQLIDGQMVQVAPSYMEKLQSAQFDINKLNKMKKGLYAAIKDMSKTAYDNPSTEQSMMLGTYKQLANVVKNHIEDLSDLTRSGRGAELKNINKNLGNLYELADSTFKLTAKDARAPLVGFKDLANTAIAMATTGNVPGLVIGGSLKGAEMATGNSISRIMSILGAKGNYGLAQGLKSKPIQLIQKPIEQALKHGTPSPAIQESVQEFSPSDTHKLNNYLYNSTDDSLKGVGERLKSKVGLEHYGEVLVKAIERGDREGKNKAIFIISQNPIARKALKDMENER